MAFPPAPNVTNPPPNLLHPQQINQPIQTNFPRPIPEIVQHQTYHIPSPTPVPADQTNSFWLKWLPGTHVSKCYGCNGEIKNPPDSVPDDLIVAYRDIRQYRERDTGQIQFSNRLQNVHFHLRAACVRARYPSFLGASALVVPSDLVWNTFNVFTWNLDGVHNILRRFSYCIALKSHDFYKDSTIV